MLLQGVPHLPAIGRAAGSQCPRLPHDVPCIERCAEKPALCCCRIFQSKEGRLLKAHDALDYPTILLAYRSAL